MENQMIFKEGCYLLRPSYAQRFDLRVGDLIRERGKKSRYRIDLISEWVMLTTKLQYDMYSGGWRDLYHVGFSKLDYIQGYIVKSGD